MAGVYVVVGLLIAAGLAGSVLPILPGPPLIFAGALLFLGPIGLLLGPVAGAIGGEFLRGGDIEESTRSGIGALVGLAAGIVASLGLAMVMVALFLWWIWRG